MALYAARQPEPLVEASHWLVLSDGRWLAIGPLEVIVERFRCGAGEVPLRPISDRPDEGVLVWRTVEGEIMEIEWPTKTAAFELFRFSVDPAA